MQKHNLGNKHCAHMKSLDWSGYVQSDILHPLFINGSLAGLALVVQSDHDPIIYEEANKYQEHLKRSLID